MEKFKDEEDMEKILKFYNVTQGFYKYLKESLARHQNDLEEYKSLYDTAKIKSMENIIEENKDRIEMLESIYDIAFKDENKDKQEAAVDKDDK